MVAASVGLQVLTRCGCRWEYIPFHGGPRICIGQQFALTQMLFTLFRVLQQFKTVEAREHGPMQLRTSTTIAFANGCMIGMTPA